VKSLNFVHVSWNGSAWAVKRVADPKVRRFKSKERALAWAKELASKTRGSVMFLGGKWEEIET